MSLPPPRPPLKPGAAAKAPPPAESAIAKARREKDELEEETRSLEEDLEALKARYEQYFLGVERKEPSRWRDELRKRVMRLKEAFTRNTGLKFRIHSLHARYLSYERLWMRSAREKEEGTYRRDVFKARLRARRDEREASAPPDAAARPAVAAATASQQAAPPKAPAPVAAPGGMGEAQMRALYAAYIAAKKSCSEDVSRLTYEAVARSVSKQIPEIMTRFQAKTVEFKVEVKGGKAVLKAVPKA
jgi:hypothetical protein